MDSPSTSAAGRRPSALASAAASVALVFGSCSGSGDGSPNLSDSRAFRAVNLAPLAELEALPEISWHELEIPAGGKPWKVQAGSWEVLEDAPASDGSAVRRLVMRGQSNKLVAIPGPFAAGTFNRIALEVQVLDSTYFTAQLMRKGKSVLGSSSVTLAYGKEPQQLVLDVPHVRAQTEPFDAIALSILGKGLVHLGRVALVRRSIEAWLPRADEEPALVVIGDEARRSRAITSAVAWEGEIELPARGRLSFSYGVPRLLHYPATEPPILRVTVNAGRAAPQVATFALDDPPANPRWHSAAIPIERDARQRAKIRFELEAPAAALALCALGEVRALDGSPEPAPEPTSVLVVTSDTHRGDYMGLAGEGIEVQTPNLDALAARGVWFGDCFSSTNVTNPSHVALMTATSPRDTGIVDNSSPLGELAPTLAERFHEAGFRTFAAVSTRHLGDDVSGLGQGFDRMSWPTNLGERPIRETLDLVESWLAEAEGAPLFLWVHGFDAHSPYEPPAEYGKLYYQAEGDPFDPALPPPDLEPHLIPTFLAGLKDLAWPEAMYRGEISSLDHELARLFETPRFRAGIVAFTADHGESLGQHGIYYDHADLYPDTIHIPLILSWPGGPQGLRVDHPVLQIDVGRTLLDLAGLERADFPGSSLLGALTATSEIGPRFTLASNCSSAAMTAGGWHLILHLRKHSERNRAVPVTRHQIELYDLTQDRACRHSLVQEEFPRAKAMREQLLAWLGSARDLGWAGAKVRDSALLAELARLGYVDDGATSRLEDFYDPDCACVWCEPFR